MDNQPKIEHIDLPFIEIKFRPKIDSFFLFRIRCLQKRTRQKLFIMGFETIWYSRPRKYGQGSRNW